MARQITGNWTRRAMIAALLSGTGTAVLARAPLNSERPLARGTVPPVSEAALPDASRDALVDNAGLGGIVSFVVAEAATGRVLETRFGDVQQPPASTLKAVTSLYGLDRLGADHVYQTRIVALGPVVNGRLEGDLALVGGGDPTLDTDRLGALASALKASGVREITGRFLIWSASLPEADRIDDEQPEYVGYNPAFGGLNLNYNRVHFEWKRLGKDYQISLQARGLKYSPTTMVVRVSIEDRKAPVYAYEDGGAQDRWSVARSALGSEGGRWLPVRYPALYAADIFRTLARSHGIVLPAGLPTSEMPEGPILAEVESKPLHDTLRGMLKYSTNLTAEVVGLTSSLSNKVPVANLLGSGSRMSGWAVEKFNVVRPVFRDHSGLGYGSSISAEDMVNILRGGGEAGLPELMKTVNLAVSKAVPAPKGIQVRAKTGTLNFVSALAGYITPDDGPELVFAIFTADTARRDAIPPEARERPQGAKSWARRSRNLQKDLLRRWVKAYFA